jgi:hypothetical protein
MGDRVLNPRARAAQGVSLLIATTIPCACIALCSSAFAESPPPKVEAPMIQKGDSWTYNSIDGWKNEKQFTVVIVVTDVTDAGFTQETKRTDNGQGTVAHRDKNLNLLGREVGNRKFFATPFEPHLSFPLEVGKTWEQEVTFTRNFDDRKVVASLKAKVLGWERISVPAGTFDALKIVINGPYNGSWSDPSGGRWSGQRSEMIWYSPEAKAIVKSTYEDADRYRTGLTKTIYELVEYKLVQ